MTDRVWQYTLARSKWYTAKIPVDAEIVHITLRGDEFRVWANVKASNPRVRRRFYIVDAKDEFGIDDENVKYIGTWTDHPHHWHVFEETQ